MGETTHKSDTHESRATLPTLLAATLAEGAESILHAQAGLLTDIEETTMMSIRSQQETLRKILDLIAEARNSSSVADHLKAQLAVSEHCINNGLTLWRDAASKWSERTLKRLESGQRSVLAMTAEERRAGWSTVEKPAAAMKGSNRRATAEAA